jgi:hypothetical protein
MTATTENKSLERLKYRLNLILIAGLCATTLAPSLIFYVRGKGEFLWMFIFIGISYFVSRLSKSFYDQVQLSTNLTFYKKLAVDKFKRFSTNGDFINRRIRKNFPNHRNVTSLDSIKSKLDETYTIEKSHTVLFVFCFLTNIYAFWTHSVSIGVVLFVGNFLFNFYPNLLQQYNRIRYQRVIMLFRKDCKSA